MTNHVAIRAINQPETAKTGKHTLFRKRQSHLIHAPRPNRPDWIFLKQIAHARVDGGFSSRYKHARTCWRWCNHRRFISRDTGEVVLCGCRLIHGKRLSILDEKENETQPSPPTLLSQGHRVSSSSRTAIIVETNLFNNTD